MHFTYLLLNGITLLFPLLFSFENRVQYVKHWKFVIPAITVTAAIFLVWDYWFTRQGIWSFNHQYTLGLNVMNLPLEEVMFFFFIPFACMFIYVIVRELLVKPREPGEFRLFILVFSIVLFIIGSRDFSRTYTAAAFIGFSFMLLLLSILKVKFLQTFFLAYLIQLIPFFIINGVLTSLPVVMYNSRFNSGIRAYTIPLEDFAYTGLLMLLNVACYEWFRSRSEHALRTG